jgi:anaerobic selenocysteine-containing dehydrogenase
MCGLEMTIEGDRVVSVRGDPNDPLSAGYICPKGPALADLHADPDRLRTPMRRRGDEWEPIGWDEAIAETTERLHAIQREHGADAVGAYLGNPNVHNLGLMLYAPSFLRTLRSKNRFSATSVDQLPAMLASYLMFGHQLLLPVPDLDRAELLLIVGANPLVSNGSLMSAPGMRKRLAGIRERGGRVIVIDPRRTETARAADEHVFVRPGGDAWVLLSMVRELLRGATDDDTIRTSIGALADHCDGLPHLRDAVEVFTPERAASHSGVPADRIRALAEALRTSDRAAVYGRFGACTQAHGALTMWATYLLNLLTGNLDREGGMMFTDPALRVVDAPKGFGVGRGSFGRWRSRVRGLPEFGGELPVVCLAEEIEDRETPGPAIRGLITVAGNPVLSTPRGRRLDRALGVLDFYVAVDPYINETTRHADLILPPTSVLERSHYDVIFSILAVRNVAKWSPPAFEPPPGAMHDWQILASLEEGLMRRRAERRAGPGSHAPAAVTLGTRMRGRAVRWLGPDRLVDLGLRLGPHKLSKRQLERAPSGIDLGPLRPGLAARLPGRIDIAPTVLLDGARALADETIPEADRLVLIGRRQLRSNNSWMHNVPKLVAGAPRCTLMMHPEDAAARGLEDGSVVAVESSVGSIEAPLQVTDEIMPGVVSLPHGWGHGRGGTRMKVAAAHPGVSVNDLTDDGRFDRVSGNAALSGVPVTVTSPSVST